MPIKIALNQPYMSIRTLKCPDLPDFAVLTGRNGAGKSHLLKAMSGGIAKISGIARRRIEFYDIASFEPTAKGDGGPRSSFEFARRTAHDYVRGEHGPPPVNVARDIFEQHAAELQGKEGKDAVERFVADVRLGIERTDDFGSFPSDPLRVPDGPYYDALQEHVMGPLETRAQRNLAVMEVRARSFSGRPIALVTHAMKSAGKLPHELTYNDIVRASHYEGETIANTISAVFTSYKLDEYEWAHSQFEASSENVRYGDLVAKFRDDNPPPWEILRDVMETMREEAGEGGLFDFEFSDPANVRLEMGDFRNFNFETTLTNRTSNTQYGLENLSSGEKILMTLCLTSFNQQLGRRRPKLLLLDEVDALLHPSMVRALVAALKSLFLIHGSKVIMATHSPMTVAALPEDAVHRVIREDAHIELVRASRSESIEALSEGIATLDVGLRIASAEEADVTILTEGNNALHLRRWAELHFPEDSVHVFDRLPEYTSDSQLLAYGRMLAAMRPATHFVVVWDCDAGEKEQALAAAVRRFKSSKVTPFAFKRRDNKIALHGIENNYDDEHLEPFAISRKDNLDGRDLSPMLPKSRKADFANFIRQQGTREHFAHFDGLRETVARVLRGGQPNLG